MKKGLFFRAAMAGLGKYRWAAMAGLGSIGSKTDLALFLYIA